jgi:intein-encoded DNA endonuclease-like protein
MARSTLACDKEAIIGQPRVIQMIENLYPDLMKEVLKMREAGKSYDIVSRYVSDMTGAPVSREVIRKWCNDQKRAS